MHNHSFDYLILGAGIAGLSLADVLQEHGQSICLIDTKGLGAGGSGTPIGMANPATGKQAKLVWRARDCYRAVHSSLQSASHYARRTIFVNNGVLRPAQSEEMAEEMFKKFRKTDWPSGWAVWMSEDEIENFHPGLNCVNGGIWLPIAFTVDVPRYLGALCRKVKEEGGIYRVIPAYSLVKRSNTWVLISDRGEKVRARNVVYAAGKNLVEHSFWQDIPLQQLKGQVAVYHIENGMDFTHSVASRGYMAHINQNKLVVGSTYEHEFKSSEPDKKGERILREKLVQTLPYLESCAELTDQWAGFRVTTPDHKPVLGDHPTLKGMHIFTGLGSKGLLYGRFLAEHYAGHLMEGTALLPEIRLGRFNFDGEKTTLS